MRKQKVESRKVENEKENEDDDYENEDDDDEIMNQNEKNEIIKDLNDNLDEIIDKSELFEEQIKSLKKRRSCRHVE